jgi:hypothetical protein
LDVIYFYYWLKIGERLHLYPIFPLRRDFSGISQNIPICPRFPNPFKGERFWANNMLLQQPKFDWFFSGGAQKETLGRRGGEKAIQLA